MKLASLLKKICNLNSNYTPVVPLGTVTIASDHSSTPKVDLIEASTLDRDKQYKLKPSTKPNNTLENTERKDIVVLEKNNQNMTKTLGTNLQYSYIEELKKKVEKDAKGGSSGSLRPTQFSAPSGSNSSLKVSLFVHSGLINLLGYQMKL